MLETIRICETQVDSHSKDYKASAKLEKRRGEEPEIYHLQLLCAGYLDGWFMPWIEL
jgi:hypothetical protein